MRYFDYVTRSFRWKEEYRDKPGEALGVWGYGIRLLEVAGFGFGGLIGALVIRKMAYCERCQQYMKRRKLASIAASLPPRKIPKKDAEALAAHQAGQQAAEQNARQSLQRLADLATRGDHAGFQGVLCDLAPAAKGAEKLPVSIKLEMVSCRQCGNGFLRASTVKRVGNRSVATQLNKWDMSPEFISSMQDFRPRRAATSTQGLR